MRLANLKRTWSTLSKEEKLDIIEVSNTNRIKAFELEIAKRQRKTTKTKKKTSSRKAPKTPAGLLNLMEKMTPEEKENFMLMINSTTKE